VAVASETSPMQLSKSTDRDWGDAWNMGVSDSRQEW
jgi:hypothetical protein